MGKKESFKKLISILNKDEMNAFDFDAAVKAVIGEYNTPQNNPHHIHGAAMFDVCAHTGDVLIALNRLENYKARPYMLLATLYHDVGKKAVKTVNPDTGYDKFIGHADKSVEILSSLREEYSGLFSDKEFDHALELVRLHDTKFSKVSKIQNMIESHQNGFTEDLFELQYADILGQSNYKMDDKMGSLYAFAVRISQVESYPSIKKFIEDYENNEMSWLEKIEQSDEEE